MNDDERSLLRTQIAHARHQLAAAQQELEDALRELRAGARADKTHVGARIERAFDTVKDARQSVAALETLLAPDPGTS